MQHLRARLHWTVSAWDYFLCQIQSMRQYWVWSPWWHRIHHYIWLKLRWKKFLLHLLVLALKLVSLAGFRMGDRNTHLYPVIYQVLITEISSSRIRFPFYKPLNHNEQALNLPTLWVGVLVVMMFSNLYWNWYSHCRIVDAVSSLHPNRANLLGSCCNLKQHSSLVTEDNLIRNTFLSLMKGCYWLLTHCENSTANGTVFWCCKVTSYSYVH